MNFTCVCFGEVLFDVLPHEIKAGGAPMNVAYHLTMLGQPTALISRVGNDDRGKALTTILEGKKLLLDYIQADEAHPTGIVVAVPDAAGDMKYDIQQEAAWDFIELKAQHETLVKNAAYFIFGSLITRNSVSRNTLFNLMDIPVTRVFDVNLRSPFIDQKTLEYQFSKADILKMNEEELDLITGWYVQFKTIEDKIRFLQNRFQIPDIIITRGAKGAIINSHDNFYYHDGYSIRVADTVGSGDSFVAGYLSGIINHKPPEEALQFACALGAYVATQTGGCPSYTPGEINIFMRSAKAIIH
ncbi:MAG: carbohydrate kinase [Chitinophagaceae bacterium]|nr:carbohydrate kinase [Chitinophagaceae bacterium]